MYTKITLVSGNVFYYSPETNLRASYAFVVDKDSNLLGGFLCNEADRKLATFKSMQNVNVECVNSMLNFSEIKFERFAEMLGTASTVFLKATTITVVDKNDCDGTCSLSQSCDERSRYYKAVGCEKLFKSYRQFDLWLFIANHVAIFGVKDFRITFFKGNDLNPQKDDILSGYTTRYYKESFKAPAAYVRALCQHK